MAAYPPDMDLECIAVCDALNGIEGIQTTESCCGHGLHPFRVFFTARTVDALLPIVTACNSSAWWVEARWSNGADVVIFMLEGPVAFDSPGGASDFACWLYFGDE